MKTLQNCGASGDRDKKLTELARLVAGLNPSCLELGAGMLATMQELANSALDGSTTPFLDQYKHQDPKESIDVYHGSFLSPELPPSWNPRWLDVGRVFTLNVHQRQTLRSITHEQTHPVVELLDVITKNGYIVEVTFKFPLISKWAKVHLGPSDFHSWVTQSDSAKALSASSTPVSSPKKAAKKATSKKATKGKSFDEAEIKSLLTNIGL